MPAVNASFFTTPQPTGGSLLHEALYQLMREGLLVHAIHCEAADRILQRLGREDGMTALRAWWVYQGVRPFTNPA
jgi:hypothetical protein